MGLDTLALGAREFQAELFWSAVIGATTALVVLPSLIALFKPAFVARESASDWPIRPSFLSAARAMSSRGAETARVRAMSAAMAAQRTIRTGTHHASAALRHG